LAGDIGGKPQAVLRVPEKAKKMNFVVTKQHRQASKQS